ncbi:MAG: hypothetical protein J4F37_10385 [Acidobacteria bacterium]|nr:hypothetical protein [Acidobacteriota bacterium]
MATIRITAAAAALVLSAALAAAETLPPGGRAQAALAAAPAAQAPEAEAAGSVAVLPFTNITGLTEDDWYGVGIVETLAAALEGAGLPVRRGESAAAADVVAAGRALGTSSAATSGRRVNCGSRPASSTWRRARSYGRRSLTARRRTCSTCRTAWPPLCSRVLLNRRRRTSVWRQPPNRAPWRREPRCEKLPPHHPSRRPPPP